MPPTKQTTIDTCLMLRSRHCFGDDEILDYSYVERDNTLTLIAAEIFALLQGNQKTIFVL